MMSDTYAIHHVDCGEGVRIGVHSYGGCGPPLLILHANGMGARSYEPMIECLMDSFQVYAADLRGHGESSPVPPGAAELSVLRQNEALVHNAQR